MPDQERPAEQTDVPEPADTADDTEGHSLQMAELGRTMAHDRSRDAEQMARESRLRDEARGAKKSGRSLFRR